MRTQFFLFEIFFLIACSSSPARQDLGRDIQWGNEIKKEKIIFTFSTNSTHAISLPTYEWPRMESERDTDDVVWIPTKTGALSPKVAFDGTQWLVVWQDMRFGVAGVYGMRIREDGTILDPIGFPISVRSTPSTNPVVTFVDSHFFVAWIDGRNQGADIYGARVDSQGRVLDPQGLALVVSAYPKSSLALASDGQDCMLAFLYSLPVNPGLYVTPVSSSGVVFVPQGIPVRINTVFQPDIAWTGTHYLISYNDGAQGYNIAASRVASDGTILEPSWFPIFGWNNYYMNMYSSVASSPSNSLISYYSYYYQLGNVTRVVRLNSDGEMLDSPHMKISMEYMPRISHTTATTFLNDRYLVTWNDYRDPENIGTAQSTADIYANVVFPDGTVMYPQGVPVVFDSGMQLNPQVKAGNEEALVVFRDQTRTIHDVRAVRIDANAQPVGNPFYVNISGNAQYAPQLATGVDSDGSFQMFVLWEDLRGEDRDIYAARLNAQGNTLDATALPVSIAYGEQFAGGVVFANHQYWAVFTDERFGDRDVYVSRITPDGEVMDSTGIAVASGEGNQEEPSIAADEQNNVLVAFTDRSVIPSRVQLVRLNADGSIGMQATLSDPMRMASNPFIIAGHFGVLAVWQAFSNGNMQIVASLLSLDGTPIWGPTAIDPSSNSLQAHPTAAFDGQHFYIAWEDNRNFYYQIHGAQLSLNGEITLSPDALAPSNNGQYAPKVLFDGSTVVVVWEEQTDVGLDIRLARIDENAVPIDDVFITQTSVVERSPVAVVEQSRTLWLAYSRMMLETPYGTFRVRVRRVNLNHVPSIPEYNVITIENTPVVIAISAEDADFDVLTYTVVQPPVSGVLLTTSQPWVYIPNTGFSGDDTFRFRVNDGYDSVEQQVYIQVLPQTVRPTAQEATLETFEDTPLEILLQGTSFSTEPLSYELISDPLHGMLKGAPPDVTYNPNENYFGEDVFSFRVSDGVSVSDVAFVRLNIIPVNDAPVAMDQEISTHANEARLIELQGYDVDFDTINFAITKYPLHGRIQGNPPFIQYIPHKNYYGDDELQFSVSDGQLTSTGVIRIVVENTLRRTLDGDATWGCQVAGNASSVQQFPALMVGFVLGILFVRLRLRKGRS